MRKYLTILIATSLLVGCKKENSSKWVVADLCIKSDKNGAPVPGWVKIQYHESDIFSQGIAKTLNVGKTDENGKIHIERKFDRKASGYSLLIYTSSYHYANGPNNEANPREVPYQKGSKSEQIILISPLYNYWPPTVRNVNCSNGQDSVWVKAIIGGGVVKHAGCGEYNPVNGASPVYIGHYGEVSFNVKVKRNGLMNEYVQSFSLAEGLTNELVIEY